MLYSNLVLIYLLVSCVRCAPSNKTTQDDQTPLAVKPPTTKPTVTLTTTKAPVVRSTASEKLIPLKELQKKPKPSLVSSTAKTVTTTRQPDLVQVVPERKESSPSLTKFQPDCADPHNKEVACSVHKVSCDEVLFENVPVGSEPPEAHDFRMNGFAKSLARRNGEHQLHVDISWQLPPKNASSNLKAFKLEVINQVNKRQKSCFVFNVTNFELNEHSSSPRFHFSSDSLFDFDTDYIVNLHSLPQSEKKMVVTQTKRMPKNPDTYFSDPANITQYCKTHSNPAASKWTASFRQIFLNSLARVIKITFNPAPAHFCFEEYELRLLDSTGIELLQVASVRTEDLITKEITENNVTRNVTYGEFNFTEVDLDVDYIPSVLPVRYAADGRCLCPTTENHGACSCISADWKKVRLHKVDPSAVAAEPEPTPVAEISNEPEKTNWYMVVGVILCIIAALIVVGFFSMWRFYHTRGKLITLKFVSDVNGMGAATAETTRAPLIYKKNISILIVYAHDCPLHENVVIAFAELLKEVFDFDVHLDVWDTDDIDRNLPEYINGSIVRADKILVINSMGAYYRDRARNLKEDPIERSQGGRLDNIFMRQIDLAMQHARVLSMRFSYTPSNHTLFGLTPMLLYAVPDNLGLLVASLNDCSMANDNRLNGYSPALSKLHAAITRMASFVQSDPKWFEKFHHRVPPLPITMAVPSGSLDSGVVSNTEEIVLPQIPQLTVVRPRDLPSSPRMQPAAVVATSPMGDENEPLLEEPTPETERMLPATPEMIPMKGFSGEGSESAYYSEEVTNEHPQELVQDRPRLHAPPHGEDKAKHFGGDPNADSGLHSMEVSS